LFEFLHGLKFLLRTPAGTAALVAGLCLTVLPAGNADAASDRRDGVQCPHALPAYRDWTPQEDWAWSSRICLGKRADMSMFGGGDGQSCEAAKAGDWPGTRNLSADFLDTILNKEPYRGTLHRSGVHIHCALFSVPVDLSNMVSDRPLRLTDTVFSDDLSLKSAKFRGHLSLDGSNAKGDLLAGNLSVDGNLSMGRNARFKRVRLTGATVSGAMDLSGAHFDGQFDATRLRLGGNLLMAGKAQFTEEVRLISARIGGELRADGSTFGGLFSAARLQVAESLFMREASFRDIRLIGAQIGGSLHLRKGRFDGDFDLTSATIADELQLNTPPGKKSNAGNYGPPRWTEKSRLILRNTRVGALNDTIDSWDGVTLDLVGFTYDRLGGLRATKDSIMAARPKEWLLDNWLAKQEGFDETFIPQPFEQLAKVLRESGHPVNADYLLMAKFNQLRDSPRTAMLTKVSLWVQYVLIGYGYRTWLAILWFLALAALGAWVCGRVPPGRDMMLSERFWYSVDIAVPVFNLDKKHGGIDLSQGCRTYFYFHQMAGFILISFALAGLSGLTK